MTQNQAYGLHPGMTVISGSLKGTVSAVDLHTAWLRWDDRQGEDMLRKTSPLWRFVELETR